MDEAHEQLHGKLDRIPSVPDAEFAEAFEALIEDVRAHFSEEEQIMEEISFPGISCHKAQHAQALSALDHALQRIREGALAEGRENAALFTQWLTFHITTMDKMLALVIEDDEAAKAAACATA